MENRPICAATRISLVSVMKTVKRALFYCVRKTSLLVNDSMGKLCCSGNFVRTKVKVNPLLNRRISCTGQQTASVCCQNDGNTGPGVPKIQGGAEGNSDRIRISIDVHVGATNGKTTLALPAPGCGQTCERAPRCG